MPYMRFVPGKLLLPKAAQLSCSLEEAQVVPNRACQGASPVVLVTCGSAVTSVTISLFALGSSKQCMAEPPCTVEGQGLSKWMCPDPNGPCA